MTTQKTDFSQLKDELLELAQEGKQHAFENKPRTNSEYKVLLLDKVSQRVQPALLDNWKQYQPYANSAIAIKVEQDANAKSIQLRGEIREKQKEHSKLVKQKEQLKQYIPKVYAGLLVYLFLLVIATGESALNFAALRFMALSIVATAWVLVAFGIVFFMLAELVATWVNRRKTTLAKAAILTCTAIVLLFMFYSLAVLRADALNYKNALASAVTGDTPAGLIAPDGLAIISFVISLTAIGIATKYHMNYADMQMVLERWKVTKALKKVEKVIIKYELELEAVKKHAADSVAQSLKARENAALAECKIVALAFEAAGLYVECNTRFRLDRAIPEFFAGTPQFSFQTYFIQTSKINEQWKQL